MRESPLPSADQVPTRGFEVLSLGYAEGPGAEGEVAADVDEAIELIAPSQINPDYADLYQGGFTGYSTQNDPPPAFTSQVDGFDPGQSYHLLLRARDASGNETGNTKLTVLAF